MPQLFSQMRMSCESYNDSHSQLFFWVVHTSNAHMCPRRARVQPVKIEKLVLLWNVIFDKY